MELTSCWTEWYYPFFFTGFWKGSLKSWYWGSALSSFSSSPFSRTMAWHAAHCHTYICDQACLWDGLIYTRPIWFRPMFVPSHQCLRLNMTKPECFFSQSPVLSIGKWRCCLSWPGWEIKFDSGFLLNLRSLHKNNYQPLLISPPVTFTLSSLLHLYWSCCHLPGPLHSVSSQPPCPTVSPLQ